MIYLDLLKVCSQTAFVHYKYQTIDLFFTGIYQRRCFRAIVNLWQGSTSAIREILSQHLVAGLPDNVERNYCKGILAVGCLKSIFWARRYNLYPPL